MRDEGGGDPADTAPSEVVRVLRIINEKGLHARASARFVEVVEAHDAAAEVEKDGQVVAGDSIMGLLTLGAARGTSIVVRLRGREAAPLADALERLLADRFGEPF